MLGVSEVVIRHSVGLVIAQALPLVKYWDYERQKPEGYLLPKLNLMRRVKLRVSGYASAVEGIKCPCHTPRSIINPALRESCHQEAVRGLFLLLLAEWDF